ncbi:alpha-1,2-galactosyltransferase gmh3-like [Canna indica]|uniref:Alpha-1,2-galactosyltransferase gmh3-like n=1 Tax=Canna indica TaxID=4628 RepID=A0AAQ3QF42_9LILI|nr:alpha-1,2-galactosyltransferase gmh3-like [Canna indica]
MATRPWTKHRQPKRRLWLLLSATAFLLTLASLQASTYLLRRANALGRQCATLPAESSAEDAASPRPSIVMVSLSDEGEGGSRRRSFRGVRAAVEGNKRAYAVRWGYGYTESGDLVDRSRPPNWSKILAVRTQLPFYDWVFWNDADTVVTNPDTSLENILHAAIGHRDFHSSPDLVVTQDFNGVNSGVFFVRRSKWSEYFLDTWWNQTSFIKFGSTKSGDNAAMKYLIDSLSEAESLIHVRKLQMQCLFNSYPWVPSWKSIHRLISSPLVTWKGVYSDGDFMVHLAGLDEKKKWIKEILEQL